MNSKGNVALAIVAVILALTLLIIYLIGLASRECGSNKDCPETAYCGSDYECHAFPEEIIVRENSNLPAAVIVGISLMAAAYIYRGRKVPFTKTP